MVQTITFKRSFWRRNHYTFIVTFEHNEFIYTSEEEFILKKGYITTDYLKEYLELEYNFYLNGDAIELQES